MVTASHFNILVRRETRWPAALASVTLSSGERVSTVNWAQNDACISEWCAYTQIDSVLYHNMHGK